MSDTTPPQGVSAFEPASAAPEQEQNMAANQVNPASVEAQELRETGMRPTAVDESKKSQESAPEKKNEDVEKATSTPSENPASQEGEKTEKTDQVVVGSGEEVAGLTQLAAQKASVAATQAKEAAMAAAASAATATKETARKYGAATVIDAERMYAVGKERVAGWVQGSQEAVRGAVQKVSAKSGEVLKNVGDKLVEAGKPAPPPADEEREPPSPPPPQPQQQGGGM